MQSLSKSGRMAEQSVTLDSGETCKVLHEFRKDRLIVDFDGLCVLVDFVDGAWMLSGRPATAEEKPVLHQLVMARPNSVVVRRG